MKNKKGMTIAELIVSIVLVSVACIYFFQTIVSINKLYSTVNEDTNLYLHKLYYYRLLMANKNKSFVTSNDDIDKYDLPYSTVYKDGKVVIKDSNGNAIDMPNIANNTDVPDDNSGDDEDGKIVSGEESPLEDDGADDSVDFTIDCSSNKICDSFISSLKKNAKYGTNKNSTDFFTLHKNFLNSDNYDSFIYIMLFLNDYNDDEVNATLFHCKNFNYCSSLTVNSDVGGNDYVKKYNVKYILNGPKN